MQEQNDKIKALAKNLQVDYEDIDISKYDENVFTYHKQEYLVVTDDEADELWEQELDNYIDEYILSELPEQYHFYFDSEKWKDDAKMDGRGHSLNRYDGNEDYETINDVDYYIYRQN